MPTHEALRKLRTVLAQLYPSKANATRLVEDVGIPIAAVALQDRPIDSWHEILKEVQKHDRLALLLEIVSEEYAENPEFRTARELFREQAPRSPASTAPDAVGWHLVHPYPMPPHFSGRVSERRLLSEWLEADRDHPLLQVRALGGFGKSALTWHWLIHDVDPIRWPQVLWWSFYESDSSFENFLDDVLTYLRRDRNRFVHHRQAVNELLRHLTRPGILLILDGFERALRAYSSLSAAYQGEDPPVDTSAHPTGNIQYDLISISPHADYFLQRLATLPHLHGKVLVTTRLTPSSLMGHGGLLLQGCRNLELHNLHPADAVALFRNLGVRGVRSEIESACAAYGFHPLSLRLLTGLVLNDLQQPGDIIVSQRFNLTGDLVQRQNHVLEQAYNSLSPACRHLLSMLACFRSPVTYDVLKVISCTPRSLNSALGEGDEDSETVVGEPAEALVALSPDFDNDLLNLLDRGLVQRNERSGRFDLHPIVRRYTYDRFGEQQRRTIHRQLRNYFVSIEVPKQVRTLDELTPLIELYHHTVKARQYEQAFALLRSNLGRPLYFQFGAYQLYIELLRALFPHGEVQPPSLKNEANQAWVLNSLANNYSHSGQPHRAMSLFERQVSIQERQDDKRALVISLANLARAVQIPIGSLRDAETNLCRSIDLCRIIGNTVDEAVGHQELGLLFIYRGMWAEAVSELGIALTIDKEQKRVQGLVLTTAYLALYVLLLVRISGDSTFVSTSLAFAQRALELADETTRTHFTHERDYVHIHWLLGAAQLANGDLNETESHLSEALTRCRIINLIENEADILIDLARLRRDQGQVDAALELVNESLSITERCGYALQGADAHLLLAELALDAGNIDQARAAAQKARDLAFCDGPPYTYYIAYTEAEALLARLK